MHDVLLRKHFFKIAKANALEFPEYLEEMSRIAVVLFQHNQYYCIGDRLSID